MPRATHLSLAVDTTLFTALQLQPGRLLALFMAAWARWSCEHFVSFPSLVRDHHAGAVVASLTVEYLAPCGFFDADELDLRFVVQVHEQGSWPCGVLEISAAGRLVAVTRLVCRAVLISEGDALSARPGCWPEHLLARFQPDEIVDDPPLPFVGRFAAQLAQTGTLLAESSHDFTVHRHLCEVADQWSFAELPALVGASREALALAATGTAAPVRTGLRQPLRRLSADLRQPYFAFDEGTVATRAYQRDDGTIAFVHRLMSRSVAHVDHGVVVEQF